MIIKEDEFTGLAHCAALLDENGDVSYGPRGEPLGFERCAGYKQQPVPAVRQTVAFQVSDLDSSIYGAEGAKVDREVEHIRFAREEDIACPHCGEQRHIADQVRPVYPQLSEKGPDALLAVQRQRRLGLEAAQTTAGAAERAAVAQERQALELQRSNDLRERELDLRERELANGHEREQRPRKAPA